MAVRPFSRIEPFSNPKDPARAIAAFMAAVGVAGIIPGLYGGLFAGLGMVSGIAKAEPVALPAAAFLAFILLGFRQLVFYVQRVTRSDVRNARGWWVSSYVYNFLLMLPCLGSFMANMHIGSAVAATWFASLSLLCLVARSSERHEEVARNGVRCWRSMGRTAR